MCSSHSPWRGSIMRWLFIKLKWTFQKVNTQGEQTRPEHEAHERKEVVQLFWWNVNSCHRVIEQARGLGKWREHRHGALNEPYHDWEQLKEGKVLKQQASWERCSEIWAPVQLRKGALNVERLPWEKTYTCFCSRAFLIWGITMATKVFPSNDQPPVFDSDSRPV